MLCYALSFLGEEFNNSTHVHYVCISSIPNRRKNPVFLEVFQEPPRGELNTRDGKVGGRLCVLLLSDRGVDSGVL